MKNTVCVPATRPASQGFSRGGQVGYAFPDPERCGAGEAGGHQVWLILAYKKPIPFIYSVGKSFWNQRSPLRRTVLLHISVSSRNTAVFAHNVEARHPIHCPHHFPSRNAGRAVWIPRLQCSLYATACKFAHPTEVAPSAFARVWVLLLPSFPAVGHPHASRI